MGKKYVVSRAKILPEVVKVLELLSQYNRPVSEYDAYRKHLKHPEYQKLNMGRDFSILAKNCLASHRYAVAERVLSLVCQELNMVDLFFFKATSIVLENNSVIKEEEFLEITDLVCCLKNVSKPEVILEYLVHVLRTNDINGAHNLKDLMLKYGKTVIRNFVIDPVLKAYLGVFDYLEWAMCCHNSAQSRLAKTSAEKAIQCFQEAIEVPGQWDIFILKLIEMLDFYGNIDDAEEILTKYVEINPKHLNGHIYLCIFLNKYNPSSEKLVEHLKVIAEEWPSDCRVLLLVEMIKDVYPKKSLKHLFMFLDYPANSENVDAWKMLSSLLVQMLENVEPSYLRTIKSCWNDRCSFWPYVHFDMCKLSIQNMKSGRIAFHKAVVLCVFEKSCHPYIQAVLQKFETVSLNLYNKLKKKLKHINDISHSSFDGCSSGDVMELDDT